MTDTKFLWTFLTWQHSWCLATGYPSWIPTFTLFCTRLSAATAPTAAVTTRIRVHLTRLSRLFHLNRSPSSGLFSSMRGENQVREIHFVDVHEKQCMASCQCTFKELIHWNMKCMCMEAIQHMASFIKHYILLRRISNLGEMKFEVMWYFNLTLGELDVGVKNNADGLIWRRDVLTSHINAQKQ